MTCKISFKISFKATTSSSCRNVEGMSGFRRPAGANGLAHGVFGGACRAAELRHLVVCLAWMSRVQDGSISMVRIGSQCFGGIGLFLSQL